MSIEPLLWDTAHFGVQISRVINAPPYPSTFDISHADQDGVECLYWLVDAGDDDGMRLAREYGFRLVDVRVTLESNIPSLVRDDPYIRVAKADELPILCELASVSHPESRFFHDDNFAPDKVKSMFQRWLTDAGCAVLAFYWGNPYHPPEPVPVGYCACACHHNIGNIDLLAVGEKHRGHGVGAALVRQALQWFRAHGMITATVTTQGRNIAAQRLYQRCGFVTKSVGLWYHRWSKEQHT